jgi:hypothetical protein
VPDAIPPAPPDYAIPAPDPDAVPLLVSRDYSRLQALARLWRHQHDPVGQVLADKLASCRVVPPDALPPSVAVLGARVAFAVEGAAAESRLLVMPEDHAEEGRTLPVSSALGAALLGAMAGQWVEAVERDGRRRLLRLLLVDQRPGRRPGGLAPDPRRRERRSGEPASQGRAEA